MPGQPNSLPGYRGLRGEILVALKKVQPATAKELGVRFGVTANALRRHLKELEAEGVVRYRREIRGVGGPVFAYSLTESGERLFPQGYDTALSAVLDLVRERLGSEGVLELFTQRWREIADRAKPELDRLPPEQRAARLAELLTSLGYMAEATAGAETTLREHNCAIRAVIQRFPEVCVAEERFLAEVLGAQVTRQRHIAAGANCCEYCISHPAEAPAPAPSALSDDIVQLTAAPKPLTAALQESP